MILLRGHSLTPEKKIALEPPHSLTLNERSSTASIRPVDMDGISVGSWLKDEKDPGAGTVWRVKAISTDYGTRTQTVQLEHIINTLRDRIIIGEITPGDMAGNINLESVDARRAVEFALSYQSDWRLGRFDFSVSQGYSFDGESVYDAIEKVTGTLRNAWWDLDTSQYPFVLNIIEKISGIASEMRAGRNLKTVKKSVDMGSMYTRFYPVGFEDLTLPEMYADRNTDLYGVIEHTETDQSIKTAEGLRAWAQERLDNHAQPAHTVDVEGVELARETGESLDRLTLGRICRMPLPEYGDTITDRITQLTYQDKLERPEEVRVTLANQQEDVSRIIARNMKSGGRSARAAGRKDKEDRAWFEDTTEHVAMCAIGIIGVDAQGNPNWERLSQIIVDGQGIHQTVVETQNGLEIAKTAIENNGREIRLEAQRREAGDNTLSASISVTATQIRSEVRDVAAGLSSAITQTAAQIRSEVSSAVDGLSSEITQNADRIALVVTQDSQGNDKVDAASIVLGINQQTGSYIKLQASKIDLDGYVTASQLSAVDAKFDNLTSGSTTAATLKTHLLSADTGFDYQNHSISFQTVTVGTTTYHLLGYQ